MYACMYVCNKTLILGRLIPAITAFVVCACVDMHVCIYTHRHTYRYVCLYMYTHCQAYNLDESQLRTRRKWTVASTAGPFIFASRRQL